MLFSYGKGKMISFLNRTLLTKKEVILGAKT